MKSDSFFTMIKGLEVLLAGMMVGCVAHNPRVLDTKPSYGGDDAAARKAFTSTLQTAKRNTRELIDGGDHLAQLAYITIVQLSEALNQADMLSCDEGRKKYGEVERAINFLGHANKDLTDDSLKDARAVLIGVLGEYIDRGPQGCSGEAANAEEAALTLARSRASKGRVIYFEFVEDHRSKQGFYALGNPAKAFEMLPEHARIVDGFVFSQMALIGLRNIQFNDPSCETRADAMQETKNIASYMYGRVKGSPAVSDFMIEKIKEDSELTVVNCTF